MSNWMVPYDANLPKGDLPLPPRPGPPLFSWTSLLCFTVAQTEWAQNPPNTTGLAKICLPPNEEQPSVASSYALLCNAYNQLLAANAFGTTLTEQGITRTWTDLGIFRHFFTDKNVATVLIHSLRLDNMASIPHPEDPLTTTGLVSARMLASLAAFAHDNPSQRYAPGLAPDHRNFPWPIPLLQPRALPAPTMPVPPPPPPQESPMPPPPPFQPRPHHVTQNVPSHPQAPPPMAEPTKRTATPGPAQYCSNCYAFGAHWTSECPTEDVCPRPPDFDREHQRADRHEGRKRPTTAERKRQKRRHTLAETVTGEHQAEQCSPDNLQPPPASSPPQTRPPNYTP
ncbi:hypothetical protein T484DRAFT_1747342 [Baffinella frigidus]|nr:hypothetical protein T484DRAFT_1747342 [Cryptophyta sp. CCMP2293]